MPQAPPQHTHNLSYDHSVTLMWQVQCHFKSCPRLPYVMYNKSRYLGQNVTAVINNKLLLNYEEAANNY